MTDALPLRVLFVCVENANRSQMAAAFARVHGVGRVEAYSAGSRPAPEVNPHAVEAMNEVGVNLSGQRPQSLSDIPPVEYAAVIGMGCGDEGYPLVRGRRHEQWDIPDPKDMDMEEYRVVRDLIEVKVKELLAGL
jgi:arsenate reductase (thioredoxin)